MNRTQNKANRRLGVILGSVAIVFFVGYVLRIAVLSGQFS